MPNENLNTNLVGGIALIMKNHGGVQSAARYLARMGAPIDWAVKLLAVPGARIVDLPRGL
jgi:hypothetical protein